MESWTSAWLCKDNSVDHLSTPKGLNIFSCPAAVEAQKKRERKKSTYLSNASPKRYSDNNRPATVGAVRNLPDFILQKRCPLLGSISFWYPQSFIMQKPPNCNFTGRSFNLTLMSLFRKRMVKLVLFLFWRTVKAQDRCGIISECCLTSEKD